MYHAVEKQVARLVDHGWTVNYTVRVSYNGDRTVPRAFQTNYVATKMGSGPKTVIAGFSNTYNGTNLGSATGAAGGAVPLIGVP